MFECRVTRRPEKCQLFRNFKETNLISRAAARLKGLAGEKVYAVTAVRWLSFFIRRDLRRAALFECSTPLRAATSSARIASRTVASLVDSPVTIWRWAFPMTVLTAERTDRLRSRRFSACRIRFLADWILAKDSYLTGIGAFTKSSRTIHKPADKVQPGSGVAAWGSGG